MALKHRIYGNTMNNLDNKDITLKGYLALACCIWGGEVIGESFSYEETIGKEESIKRALELYEAPFMGKHSEKTTIQKTKEKHEVNVEFIKYINIKMIDVKTNKVEMEFKNAIELSDHLGLSLGRTNTIIKDKKIRKGKTFVAEINPKFGLKNENRMRFLATNINTGEEIVCDNVHIAHKATGLSKYLIYTHNKSGAIHEATGWKFSTLS